MGNGEDEIRTQNFVGKVKPLRTPRHKWEDNIKLNLREAGIHLAQDRNWWQVLVNMATNVQVH